MRPVKISHASSAGSAGRRPARAPAPTGLAWVCLSALLSGLLSGSLAASAEESITVDGIAAQVGSEIVLISEVERTSSPLAKRMRDAGSPPSQIAMMRAEALEQLIEGKLIAGVVKRTELGATDDEVSQAIDMIARDAGLTLDQLVQSVTSHGMSIDEYRAQIRQEIERSKVINTMVRSRVRIEPDEIYNLFLDRYANQPEEGGEQVWLRHILLSSGVSALRSHESACGELEDVRRRVISGETNFDQAARSVSDFKAEVGGDLGWMHATDLAMWMAPAISSLEPGQMTPVLEMGFGCNLLMLVERRDYVPTRFADVERELEAKLHEQKTAEEYTEWVEKLRTQTYIERKGAFAETTRLRDDGGGPGRRP